MGRIQSNSDKILLEVFPTENAWNGESAAAFEAVETVDLPLTTQERRYTIAPEVMMAAQRQGRDRQLSIIGIYHSHPDHPASPSEFDRVCAWLEYSYIIVSVQQGKATDVRNWSLDCHDQFRPEEIIRAGSIGTDSGYYKYL